VTSGRRCHTFLKAHFCATLCVGMYVCMYVVPMIGDQLFNASSSLTPTTRGSDCAGLSLSKDLTRKQNFQTCH
jgi:hypothetical protein